MGEEGPQEEKALGGREETQRGWGGTRGLQLAAPSHPPAPRQGRDVLSVLHCEWES